MAQWRNIVAAAYCVKIFLHFDSSWGGHFAEKTKKKSFFERLWGENGHNSINIKPRALKLLAFDRELNFS